MQIKTVIVVFLVFTIFSCEKEGLLKEGDFQFIKRHCTMVTVGGVVGIKKRCFEVGDVFVGYRKNEEIVTIRIAEHSALNEGPPTSASYQEFLDVPSEYLKLRQ